MANRRYSSQFRFSFHHFPVSLDANFVVDSTNGNGLGLRSLKTEGITAVYMHTTATPAAGSPNPASGYIFVQFDDSYNSYIDGYSGQVAPLSGTPITSGLTVGVPYVIVSLGSTTTAQWQTAGFPANVTPSVGASFIAAATSVAGGGSVEAVLVSGIDHIEVVGDPRTTLTSNQPGKGGYMILKCLSAGSVTAPADGSVIGLDFQMSNSNLY
jgi:hypothetical protein